VTFKLGLTVGLGFFQLRVQSVIPYPLSLASVATVRWRHM